MQRVTQFSFRVNKDERRAIADLASRLHRSQSDAVRFVVIKAARQLAQSQVGSACFDNLPAPTHEVKEGMNVTG